MAIAIAPRFHSSSWSVLNPSRGILPTDQNLALSFPNQLIHTTIAGDPHRAPDSAPLLSQLIHTVAGQIKKPQILIVRVQFIGGLCECQITEQFEDVFPLTTPYCAVIFSSYGLVDTRSPKIDSIRPAQTEAIKTVNTPKVINGCLAVMKRKHTKDLLISFKRLCDSLPGQAAKQYLAPGPAIVGEAGFKIEKGTARSPLFGEIAAAFLEMIDNKWIEKVKIEQGTEGDSWLEYKEQIMKAFAFYSDIDQMRKRKDVFKDWPLGDHWFRLTTIGEKAAMEAVILTKLTIPEQQQNTKRSNIQMDKIEFNKLLEAGESSWLDWKQDFPPGLLKNKTDPQWEQGKGTLLKDLVSIANGEGEQWGYLIYGVKDLGTTREVKGITKNWDDATFQSWVKNAFDPPPRFLYLELAWDPAKTVGIFQIERIPEYPHVTNTSIGKVLLDGQVWFRKGTKNTVAHRAELQTMILGHQPVISPTIEGPVIEKAVSYYQELGFELAFPLITDKDNKILKGYTVACYPGTRREVHVGDVNGRQNIF